MEVQYFVQVKKKIFEIKKKKGQIGMDPQNENKMSDNLEEQTEQVLKNLGAVLKEGGSDYSKVLKTTILLTDMKDFDTVNKIYSQCKLN